jgi:hypothetical protein
LQNGSGRFAIFADKNLMRHGSGVLLCNQLQSSSQLQLIAICRAPSTTPRHTPNAVPATREICHLEFATMPSSIRAIGDRRMNFRAVNDFMKHLTMLLKPRAGL